MDKIIKRILKKIEDEGYEAYVVGGYVRDKLLGKESYDVDICTNALPMQLKSFFQINQNSNNYGGFNLKIQRYNIDITTYRKEKKYEGHSPSEIEYITSLFEDVKRRDFTINSFCMDQNGSIIDLLEAKEDLNNHLIKVIGDSNEKFSEDPLRMLRAIRFATVLDFKLDNDCYKAICANASLVCKLSDERIKEELTKILSSVNFEKGFKLLETTGIAKEIGFVKNGDVKYTSDILGMWSQIEVKRVNFSNTEKESIKQIKQILLTNKVDNFTLFNHGLYLSSVAGEILGIDKKTLNRKFHYLPIKSMKDIDIDGKDIMELLNIKPCKKISEIMLDVRNQILLVNIKNKKSEIKKYILGKWQNE